ncbi:hypothetical protein GOP47_0007307 [Adiantum capillus-veneris]|uniref:Uncharacterized protein n=1 Tax=Adiantum capillus-veneris TaxID=13818 RepID=A0A9D4ZJ36_ADICA|nr:hypothetical protein GOP47_0007307 [Adiantum capillus-veneris]
MVYLKIQLLRGLKLSTQRHEKSEQVLLSATTNTSRGEGGYERCSATTHRSLKAEKKIKREHTLLTYRKEEKKGAKAVPLEHCMYSKGEGGEVVQLDNVGIAQEEEGWLLPSLPYFG